MIRTRLAAALAATFCFASLAGAGAETYVPPPPVSLSVPAAESYRLVCDMLGRDGYEIVEVSRTFLGRVRILAQDRLTERELILSSSTGEIKRDVITPRDAVIGIVESNAGSSAGGSGSGTANGSKGGSGGGSGSGSQSLGDTVEGVVGGVETTLDNVTGGLGLGR